MAFSAAESATVKVVNTISFARVLAELHHSGEARQSPFLSPLGWPLRPFCPNLERALASLQGTQFAAASVPRSCRQKSGKRPTIHLCHIIVADDMFAL
jgi:hypothetical protein